MTTLEPFFGLWKLNRENSQYELGVPPQEGTYQIEPEGEQLKVTMDWTTQDGQHFHQIYYGTPDGKDHSYTDAPAIIDTMSMTLIDERTLDSDAKKGEQVVSYARRVLSADGRTMTIKMSGKNPQGIAYTNTAIYEKINV